MAKYKDVMDRIEVSDEMQSRVLKNVDQHFAEKRKKVRMKRRMKMWIPAVGVLAAAALLVIILKPWEKRTEITATEQPTEVTVFSTEGATDVSTEDTGNPTGGYFFVTEHPSLSTLSGDIGFEVKGLSSFTGSILRTEYRNISNTYAQIDYIQTGQTISYRMSKGKGDNSGYYDEELKESHKEIRGADVTMKKNAKGNVCLAFWTDGTYAYSIFCEQGITEEEASLLVADTLK